MAQKSKDNANTVGERIELASGVACPPLRERELDNVTDTIGIAGSRPGRVRQSTMLEANLGAIVEPGGGHTLSRTLAGPYFAENGESESTYELAFGIGPQWQPVNDATMTPWRCICHLEIDFGDVTRGPGFGTGWLVDERTVITAAHNIENPKLGRAHSIMVTPGRNRGGTGLGRRIKGDVAFTHPRWSTRRRPPAGSDLGCVKLKEGITGSFLGAFGLRVMTDRQLKYGAMIVNVAGYPSHAGGSAMWRDSDRLGWFSDNLIYYNADTERGVSGAPVFATFPDGQRHVVGVHSGGTVDGTRNKGVRITNAAYDLIHRWINNDGAGR